jgi:hypothetical protein
MFGLLAVKAASVPTKTSWFPVPKHAVGVNVRAGIGSGLYIDPPDIPIACRKQPRIGRQLTRNLLRPPCWSLSPSFIG